MQIARLTAPSIVKDKAGGLDPLEPMDHPAIHLLHRDAWPDGAAPWRMGVPIVDVDAVGPIGRFSEANDYSGLHMDGVQINGRIRVIICLWRTPRNCKPL